MGVTKERQEHLRGIVLNLPDSPGCYQYLDETGTIIYVGKAKRLKRRVSSYFNKEQQTRKTQLLVSKIHDIKYVVVPTEADALLLENNLIKRYNRATTYCSKTTRLTLPSPSQMSPSLAFSRPGNVQSPEPPTMVLTATSLLCMPC